jgi:hypothetical protein
VLFLVIHDFPLLLGPAFLRPCVHVPKQFDKLKKNLNRLVANTSTEM